MENTAAKKTTNTTKRPNSKKRLHKDDITVKKTTQDTDSFIAVGELDDLIVFSDMNQNMDMSTAAVVVTHASTTPVLMSLPLGNDRYIKNGIFNESPMINVRQYHSEGYPTKKGLAMTLVQWVELIGCIDQIDHKLEHIRSSLEPDFKHHLGSNKYVRVSTDFNGVDLRKFWLPDGSTESVPTRSGIMLTSREWQLFKDFAKNHVPKYVPEVETTTRCLQRADHANQLGYLECMNCNPNFVRLQAMQVSI